MSIDDIRPAAIDAGQSFEEVQHRASTQAVYNAAVHAQICDNIKNGNRPVTAAQMAGIPSHTFHRWVNLGKNGDPKFSQFAEDVEVSVGVFEGKMAEKVVLDADTDAKSAQWMLERRFPEGYSKEVDARVSAIMANFMTCMKEGLTDAEFFKVLAIASGFSGNEAVRLSTGTNGPEEPKEIT